MGIVEKRLKPSDPVFRRRVQNFLLPTIGSVNTVTNEA